MNIIETIQQRANEADARITKKRDALRAAMPQIAEAIDLIRSVFPNAKVTWANEGREIGKRDNSRSITLEQRK